MRALVLVLAFVLVPPAHLHASPTTAQQARAITRNWLRQDSRPLGANVSAIIAGTREFRDASGNPSCYAVDLSPSGYVIVAADDLVEPIVAFSPDGVFDHSVTTPLGRMISADLPARVGAARKTQTGGSIASEHASRAQGKWNALLGSSTAPAPLGSMTSISDPRVDPFVQSTWDQKNVCGEACYNYYTPPYSAGSADNYYVGCTATAMAQLMRYYPYPSLGVGLLPSSTIYICGSPATRSLRGGDGFGGPYEWANMPLQPGCGMTLEQRQAIGALCADAGVAIETNFCNSGSGATMMAAVNALRSVFLFSNAKLGTSAGSIPTDTLSKMINPNLHARYPVLLGILTSTLAGHAVVCDGYGYDASTMYHHLNMGWSGQDNVWYNLPNVDATNYQFSIVSDCAYNIYTSGTGEIISGRVTSASGSPIAVATVSTGTTSTTTDARGLYALVKVPSNTTFTVSASKPGYVFPRLVVTTGRDTSYVTGNVSEANISGQPVIAMPEIKLCINGTAVGASGVAVTAVFGDWFYVENQSRSSGILCHKAGHSLSIGIEAEVIGALATDGLGERYIEAANGIARPGDPLSVDPLNVVGKALGGADWEYTSESTAGQQGVKDGAGLNNIGLLVKTSGQVTYVDPAGAFAYIDDGSNLADGNTLGPEGTCVLGVRVILPAGVTIAPGTQRAKVVGMSSMFAVGGQSVRALKARLQQDITPL